MSILSRIYKISYDIATIKSLGRTKIGALVASFLVFPLLVCMQLLARVSTAFLQWFVISGIVLFLFMIYGAMKHDPENGAGAIVLNRVLGLLIAFWAVPLRLKVMFFGFILFHVIDYFLPAFFKKFFDKLSSLPGLLGVVAKDVIAGLLVNMLLLLILWVAH
jgi:phosphatidylglycerophosphatase A